MGKGEAMKERERQKILTRLHESCPFVPHQCGGIRCELCKPGAFGLPDGPDDVMVEEYDDLLPDGPDYMSGHDADLMAEAHFGNLGFRGNKY